MTIPHLNEELTHVKTQLAELLARKYELEGQIMHQEKDALRQAFFKWDVCAGNYLFLVPKSYDKELITYYIDCVVLSNNVCNIRKSIYRYSCEEYTLYCEATTLSFSSLAQLEDKYNIYVVEESEHNRINLEFTKLNIENSNVKNFIETVKYLRKIS